MYLIFLYVDFIIKDKNKLVEYIIYLLFIARIGIFKYKYTEMTIRTLIAEGK